MANNKKKSLAQRIGAVVVGIVVLAVVGFGAAWGTGFALTGEYNPLNWNAAQTQPGGEEEEPKTALTVFNDRVVNENGDVLPLTYSFELPDTITYVAPQSEGTDNTEYSPTGEITVTAQLSNKFIKERYSWSVNFPNGSSASEKIQITPQDENAESVQLKLLATFDIPITLHVQIDSDTYSTSATCQIDCLQTVTMSFPEMAATDFDDVSCYTAEVVIHSGTVLGDFTLNYANLTPTVAFVEKFKSHLKFDVEILTLSVHSLACETFKNGSKTYASVDGDVLSYSMFIKDFDTLINSKKQAIYYAWYTAYNECKAVGMTSNMTLDIQFTYSIAGVTVTTLTDNDCVGTFLNGSCYGYGIEPDVTLNGNIIL